MEPDDIADLFAAFGPVTVRAMFGGQGLYADGLMFALQAGSTLYLKADAAFAETLAARGSAPFSYATATGTRTVGGYWQVPEAAMDDPEDLAGLARAALAIARAAAAARPKRARRAAVDEAGGAKSGAAKSGGAKSSGAKRAVAAGAADAPAPKAPAKQASAAPKTGAAPKGRRTPPRA